MRWPVIIAIAVAGVSVACSSQESDTPGASPISVRAEAKGFVLEVSVPGGPLSSSDEIRLPTRLTWMGAAPNASIWGSGMGPVSFVLTEVGGRRRTMGGVMSADCSQREFARGVAADVPFQKAGAYSENDPDAAFYRDYYADPSLHLPVGDWQLQVSASGYLAMCEANAPALELALRPIILAIR